MLELIFYYLCICLAIVVLLMVVERVDRRIAEKFKREGRGCYENSRP